MSHHEEIFDQPDLVTDYKDLPVATVYIATASRAGRYWKAIVEELPGGRVALLGDGVDRYRDRILAVAPSVLLPRRSFFLAASLGRIACERLQAGGGVDAAELRPLYLRAPDIRVSPRVAAGS